MCLSAEPLWSIYYIIHYTALDLLDLVGMGLTKLLIFVLFYKGLITFLPNFKKKNHLELFFHKRQLVKNNKCVQDLWGASSLRPQAPKLKLGLITFTQKGLNLINCKTLIILHHLHCCCVYIPGTTCLHIPVYILFIKFTVCCIAHFIVLHIVLFFSLPIFIYSLVLCYVFCTVHWADLTWFTFHYWLYSVLIILII